MVGLESEAGPSKKRKVAANKGKAKAKEVKLEVRLGLKSEPGFGFREMVEELRGLREDLKEFRGDYRNSHRVWLQIAHNSSHDRTDWTGLQKWE